MERTTETLSDELIIKAFKQQCIDQGIDPERQPYFATSNSAEELNIKLSKYSEVIEVIEFFVNKFLSSVEGNPILVAISDHEGYLLAFKGDPAIIDTVRQLGIREGVQFNDGVGINSISLCLRYRKPFQVRGKDHHHGILQRLVCCTAPFFKEDGCRVLGTISFMVDIDVAHPHLLPLLCTMADSIERELLLRKGNAQLQFFNSLLLETNYLGVIITDEYGTIVKINENSLEILRTENGVYGSYVGINIFELENIGPYFQQVTLHQKECNGLELTQEREGYLEHYMLDVVPVFDSGGSLNYVIGVLRNITEMKKTEAVLRNTEKLVFAGQLAMGIAHEIRNPLTTVKGMLQLSHKESQLMQYDLIMSEIERMNLIVSEFLILGKPQAVQFKSERCSTILMEILSIFAVQLEMNNIILNMQIHSDTEIECDPNGIKQVFLNILRNSMEALPFGGNITITLDVLEGFQRITFTDNGEGMVQKVLQRIGEPFYTTRGDGNGLGIMIVKKIVSTHRGHIKITSEVEIGTTVTISLPIKSFDNKD